MNTYRPNTNPNYRSGYERRRRKAKIDRALVICGGILLCALLLGGCVAYNQDSTVTLKVTGKESVNTQDGHEYRIYAEDEVYVMKDNLVKGRFRTANDYARIKEGKTYSCTSNGWRIPVFSTFKNLRDCQEVTP